MALNQYCTQPQWAARQYLGANIVGYVSLRGFGPYLIDDAIFEFPGLACPGDRRGYSSCFAPQEIGARRLLNNANDRRNLLDEMPGRSAPF